MNPSPSSLSSEESASPGASMEGYWTSGRSPAGSSDQSVTGALCASRVCTCEVEPSRASTAVPAAMCSSAFMKRLTRRTRRLRGKLVQCSQNAGSWRALAKCSWPKHKRQRVWVSYPDILLLHEGHVLAVGFGRSIRSSLPMPPLEPGLAVETAGSILC